MAPNTGVLNQVVAALGGDGSTFYLMQASYFHGILFSMDIWRNIGWDSIIYLAAISSVDQELYEAASMDGCNRLEQIWHVTLPGIRGTIGLLFIMGVGGLLSSGFEQMWLLRTPGNMSVADTLDVYVVRIGLQNAQFGLRIGDRSDTGTGGSIPGGDDQYAEQESLPKSASGDWAQARHALSITLSSRPHKRPSNK